MLERISEVQGIGLLYQANGKPFTCQKATFIYADNGRGKSTLASILRSVSIGDASILSNRKTIDGALQPKVSLQFSNGQKTEYVNGAWTKLHPEVLVFDAEFIERNVHSGGTVSTGHRKNLLEFALGEAAVAARADVEKATADAKLAAEKEQGLTAQLSGHHSGITLAVFEKLAAVTDADTKIQEYQKRIVAAGNVATILKKVMPTAAAIPTINIDGFFSVLATSLKDIHADAEKLVKEHVASLGNKSAEGWLSQGRLFDNGQSCPYCAQSTTGNGLIQAYQTHFNAAYGDLKTKVAGLANAVAAATSGNVADSFSQSVITASAHAAAWTEHLKVTPIEFNSAACHGALNDLRVLLTELAKMKQASPTDPVGTDGDKQKAVALWEQVVAPMQATNATINGVATEIDAYKGKLASENVQQLQQEIANIQASKRRHDPNVVQIFDQLATARSNAQLAEKAKKTARETLDALMQKTLDQYEKAINSLLKSFGASFSIKGMNANFRGAAPRSEYGLELRGKNVSLEGGPPSFATALSEGDKRTLAFAFFVASAMADPNLGKKIVVIDDPMCSLDLNRRHHTRVVLRKIFSKSEQLLVLAHDPYFLRDLRESFKKEDKAASIATFQLSRTTGEYSTFSSIDLDAECESAYFRHHRMLNDFVDGKGGDARAIAKTIRPMLEGYLHRRFPGRIPKDLLFGQVVVLIRDAKAPSPLCHAQTLVEELNEINEYAGQFHHDTNPSADTVVVVEPELKTFIERALGVVHRGV